MIWLVELLELALCISLGFGGVWLSAEFLLRKDTPPRRWSAPLAAGVTLPGCLLVAALLHEPVPRVHDEFSYELMGETLAAGHASEPAPPLPEFFETFHVLVHPTYARVAHPL